MEKNPVNTDFGMMTHHHPLDEKDHLVDVLGTMMMMTTVDRHTPVSRLDVL